MYNGEIYICSLYYVFTTVATVGYGDIHPQTSIERVYSIFLMIVGVVAFSFLSGSLASIL